MRIFPADTNDLLKTGALIGLACGLNACGGDEAELAVDASALISSTRPPLVANYDATKTPAAAGLTVVTLGTRAGSFSAAGGTISETASGTGIRTFGLGTTAMGDQDVVARFLPTTANAFETIAAYRGPGDFVAMVSMSTEQRLIVRVGGVDTIVAKRNVSRALNVWFNLGLKVRDKGPGSIEIEGSVNGTTVLSAVVTQPGVMAKGKGGFGFRGPSKLDYMKTWGCPAGQDFDGVSLCVNADEVLFQRGMAAYNALDYGSAQVLFDQLWDNFPASTRRDNAGYLRGRCRYELMDYAGAITTLDLMRSTYPAALMIDSAAYFDGRARYHLLDYTGARADFAASVAADPAGLFADNAAYFLGRTDYELLNYALAQTELAAMESGYPTSTYIDNARYYLGRAYFDAADFTNAIGPLNRVFQTAGSIYGDDARFYIGRSYYGLLQYSTAITQFESLTTNFPSSQYVDNALYYEARAYTDQGQCAIARVVLNRLASQFPASTYLPTAQAYLTAGGC